MSRTCPRVFIVLLFALALGVRIYLAWQERVITDPDASVVALMTKHIAEGREFPVFFYGQAYMGALEQYVGAVFVHLFGASGFVIRLQTLLMTMLALPVVYLWARSAGGSAWAGVGALAYLVTGPVAFLYFQVSPRGGYGAALLFGPLVLWLAARLATDLCAGRAMKLRECAALGLAAGLGWWSNQILAEAIVAAGLVLLGWGRLRIFRWRAAATATAAFLLGSLPFWIWNIRNGWASFALAQNGKRVTYLEGLQFFHARMVDMLTGGAMPAWIGAAAALIIAGCVLACVASIARKAWRGTDQEQIIHLSSAVLFLVVAGAMYGLSDLAEKRTARYVIVLVPALAVAVGVAAARLARTRAGGVAALPLAIALLPGAWELAVLQQNGPAPAALAAALDRAGAYFRAHHLEAAYAHFRHYPLNFHLDEEFAVTLPGYDRYPPQQERAERAREVGVLDNHGAVLEMIAAAGGSAVTGLAGPMEVTYGFTPPPADRVLLPPSTIVSVTSTVPEHLSDAMDDMADTVWKAPGDLPRQIEITFAAPVEVCGLRMMNAYFPQYPEKWSVEGLPEGSPDWAPLLTNGMISYYAWSGPRIFPRGASFRMEGRWPPMRLRGLRANMQKNGPFGFRIGELHLFGPAAALPAESESWPDLVGALQELGITQAYADRWLALRIDESTRGRIRVPLEAGGKPQEAGPVPFPEIGFAPGLAVVVRKDELPLAERVLRQAGHMPAQRASGPWMIYYYPPGARTDEITPLRRVVWAGFTPLLLSAKP